MAVIKQEGTVDLWAMGDYVPHWVFKCEKGHQAEVPADAGVREAHHERLLQQLERGVCPYCEAS